MRVHGVDGCASSTPRRCRYITKATSTTRAELPKKASDLILETRRSRPSRRVFPPRPGRGSAQRTPVASRVRRRGRTVLSGIELASGPMRSMTARRRWRGGAVFVERGAHGSEMLGRGSAASADERRARVTAARVLAISRDIGVPTGTNSHVRKALAVKRTAPPASCPFESQMPLHFLRLASCAAR